MIEFLRKLLSITRSEKGSRHGWPSPRAVAQRVRYAFLEEDCPGHVASDDPKVCRRCGVHVDSFRPEEDEP